VQLTLQRNASPRLILAIICIGIFIAAADQTVIYGALPDMMPDLHLTAFELDQAAWIVIGYLLGYTMAMPLMGRVSDVYGHGRIFMLSVFIFMVGSIFVALASSIHWIVGARVFQAVGGGAMVPIAMAIVGDIFPERGRPIALGVIGGAVEAGAALGPFYGGLFADFVDWRWIFWINLPVSLVVIMLVLLLLGPGHRAQGKIDYIGGILLAAGLTFLSLALCQEWGLPGSIGNTVRFLAFAVCFFVLFVFRQVRTSQPLIEFSMFKKMTFSSASATNLFVGGALIMALVNVPLMSDTILGCSAFEGGLRLLRLTILISVGAVVGGYLCRQFGYYLPTMMGLVQRGIGSSLALMMRMIGMIIGLSVLTAWGMGSFHIMTIGMSLEEVMSLPEEFVASLLDIFHDFFLAAIGICLAGMLPALWLGKRRKLSSTKKSDDTLP